VSGCEGGSVRRPGANIFDPSASPPRGSRMQGQTPPTSDKSPFAIGKRLHDSGNFEQAEQRPRQVIRDIHDACRGTAEAYGPPDNYLTGANVAGFERVAGAMLVDALDPSRAIPADGRVGWGSSTEARVRSLVAAPSR
jgi:hypothetical protein